MINVIIIIIIARVCLCIYIYIYTHTYITTVACRPRAEGQVKLSESQPDSQHSPASPCLMSSVDSGTLSITVS